VLDSHARQSGHRFHLIDKLYLALGWGWGHGAAHVIFFYLSFLPLTTGNGTW
jgi:anterior pharynx defective protein 1